MSNDEQMAAIGRLVTDRAAAKQQLGLVTHKVSEFTGDAIEMSNAFRRNTPNENQRAMELLDGLVARGGLQQLKLDITERIALTERVAALEQRAREAGIL